MMSWQDTLTALVQHGDLDFALGAAPHGNTGLYHRAGLRDRLMLVSSRAINGASLTPCRLRDLKLIVPSRKTFPGSSVDSYISSGELRPHRTLEIEGVTATLEMARHSDSVTIFPFISMHRDIRRQEFYVYPIIDPPMSFNLSFVFDPRRPLAAASRAFSDMLEAALRDIDADRQVMLGD